MLYRLSERVEKLLKRYCVTFLKINKRYCFNTLLERDKFMVRYENFENQAVEDYSKEQAQTFATADWSIEQDGTALVYKYKGVEKGRMTI